MVTADTLQQILPRAQRPWLDAVAACLPNTTIDTPNEIASVVAQLAQESRELTLFEESFNYTPQAIISTFNTRVKRFLPEEAERYGRTTQHAADQQAIANIAYANRMGNGPAESGDGWKYRGRGPIQITGALMYITCGRGIGQPLLSSPELLLVPAIGVAAAFWYWREKNLDNIDDDLDVRAETLAVNGGDHGLSQRQAYFDRAMQFLKEAA